MKIICSFLYRWNEHIIRDVRSKDIITYREELDGLVENHICFK